MHIQISRLFKDAPDLRSDFRIFMPEKSQSMFEETDDMYDAPGPSERRSGRTGTPILDKTANAKRVVKDKVEPIPPTVPQKRKRKTEKEKEKEKEALAASKAIATSSKVSVSEFINRGWSADVSVLSRKRSRHR